MDSTTLLLVIVPLLLGFVAGAVRFMRFIGFVAGGGKRPTTASRNLDNYMSFDERVAERLRELEQGRR